MKEKRAPEGKKKAKIMGFVDPDQTRAPSLPPYFNRPPPLAMTHNVTNNSTLAFRKQFIAHSFLKLFCRDNQSIGCQVLGELPLSFSLSENAANI